MEERVLRINYGVLVRPVAGFFLLGVLGWSEPLWVGAETRHEQLPAYTIAFSSLAPWDQPCKGRDLS